MRFHALYLNLRKLQEEHKTVRCLDGATVYHTETISYVILIFCF